MKARKQKSKSEFVVYVDKFKSLFPSDAACLREFWRRTYNTDEAYCQFCNTSQPDFSFNKRSFKCRTCKRKNSVTAGTMFENVRLPGPWLARIWFFENRVAISSNQFSQLFKIAPSTSMNIFKKIMLSALETLPPPDIPSSDFQCVLIKRSSETPANEHPRSELQSNANVEKVESVPPPELEKNDALIFDLLQLGSRLSIDQLLSRSLLGISELAASLWTLCDLGLVTRLPGDLHERVEKPSRPSMDGLSPERLAQVRAAITFIRSTNHGISRKYVQLYLCAFAIISNHQKWNSGALLRACCAAIKTTDAQVRAYVSPYYLSVA